MSLEDAIYKLAESINGHAAALRESAGKEFDTALKLHSSFNVMLADDAPLAVPAEAATKPEVKNFGTAPAPAPVEPDEELEQAVQKVEADAKNAASGAAEPAGTKAGAPSDDVLALTYDKDVKPLFVKMCSLHGKDSLQPLLLECGLQPKEKGDKLNAEQLVVAKRLAEKMIATPPAAA